MIALCIDASGLNNDKGFTLQENERYDVQEEIERDGQLYYLIHQSLYFLYYYDARRFILTSEIEELELANQQFETL